MYILKNSVGGEDRDDKVLNKTRQYTSLPFKGRCSNGASLGAQRLAGLKTTSGKSASPVRVGRERLGLKSGKKRGFGPLDRWVEALETGRSSSKEEDKGGGDGEKGSLGPGVWEIKRRNKSLSLYH